MAALFISDKVPFTTYLNAKFDKSQSSNTHTHTLTHTHQVTYFPFESAYLNKGLFELFPTVHFELLVNLNSRPTTKNNTLVVIICATSIISIVFPKLCHRIYFVRGKINKTNEFVIESIHQSLGAE